MGDHSVIVVVALRPQRLDEADEIRRQYTNACRLLCGSFSRGAALGVGAAVYGMITLGLAGRDGSDKGVARRRRDGLFGLYFGTGVVLLSLASWLSAQDSIPLALLALTAAMCLSLDPPTKVESARPRI